MPTFVFIATHPDHPLPRMTTAYTTDKLARETVTAWVRDGWVVTKATRDLVDWDWKEKSPPSE